MSEKDRTIRDRINPLGDRLGAAFGAFEGPHTFGNSPQFWSAFLLVVAFAAVYPFMTNSYALLQTTGLLVWVFLSLSLTLIWGYTGIFSFGQTAFFGLGGYTFGVVGINLVNVTGATTIALIVAVVVPALFAALLGYFMFYGRISGVYVAIITLAVTLILALLFSRTAGSEFAIGDAQLGGYNGMTGIPSIQLGGGPLVVELGPSGMYYFILVLLVGGYLLARYVLQSDYGYIMIGIREAQERTEMFGYDIRRVKLQVFTVAGGIAGLSGALYASVGGFISPPVMGLAFAALPVIWVTVGGREALLGAILGTLGLRALENDLAASGSEFATLFLGGLLMIAVLVIPDGVIPTALRLWNKYTERGIGE